MPDLHWVLRWFWRSFHRKRNRVAHVCSYACAACLGWRDVVRGRYVDSGLAGIIQKYPSHSDTLNHLFTWLSQMFAVSLELDWFQRVIQAQHLLWRRRQWHPTPVLVPGKSHGRRSLVGCSPWGHESDTYRVASLSLFTFMCWRRKWQPTPVFLLGESQPGGLSSMGSHRVRHDWSDLTAVTLTAPIHQNEAQSSV